MLSSLWVWFSRGMVQVPNLVGLSRTNAISSITSAGLNYAGDSSTTTSNSSLDNTVASQSPLSGTLVDYNSDVTFVYYTYSSSTTTTTTPASTPPPITTTTTTVAPITTTTTTVAPTTTTTTTVAPTTTTTTTVAPTTTTTTTVAPITTTTTTVAPASATVSNLSVVCIGSGVSSCTNSSTQQAMYLQWSSTGQQSYSVSWTPSTTTGSSGQANASPNDREKYLGLGNKGTTYTITLNIYPQNNLGGTPATAQITYTPPLDGTTTTTTTVAPTTTTTTTVASTTTTTTTTAPAYWATGCCSSSGLQVTGTSVFGFTEAYAARDAQCSGGTITSSSAGNYGTIPTLSCPATTTTTTTTAANTYCRNEVTNVSTAQCPSGQANQNVCYSDPGYTNSVSATFISCVGATTTTTTTTTAASVTYYIGSSACNANSGCYISGPSVSGPYTAASMPTDVISGPSTNREKTVYRATSADALAAAANASCVNCSTTTTTTVAPTTTTTTTTAAPTGAPYWYTGCCSTSGSQVTGTSYSNFGEAYTGMTNQCAGTVTSQQSGNYGTVPSLSCPSPTTTTTTVAPTITTTTTVAPTTTTTTAGGPFCRSEVRSVSTLQCPSGNANYNACYADPAYVNQTSATFVSCVGSSATTTTAAPATTTAAPTTTTAAPATTTAAPATTTSSGPCPEGQSPTYGNICTASDVANDWLGFGCGSLGAGSCWTYASGASCLVFCL